MGRTPFKQLREELYTQHPEVLEGKAERVRALREYGERYQHTLAQIRKARALTQEEVAAALQVSQPDVSKLENRSDAYLSTLAKYVEALGGRLRLVAEFDGESYPIALGDLMGAETVPEAAGNELATATSAIGSEFGAWLTARRRELRLTQTELAARLSESLGRSVNVGRVSEWEAGTTQPRPETAASLRQILGVAESEECVDTAAA